MLLFTPTLCQLTLNGPVNSCAAIFSEKTRYLFKRLAYYTKGEKKRYLSMTKFHNI